MTYKQARMLATSITSAHRAVLARAHERYMQLADVYGGGVDVQQVIEDRLRYAHLLVFTEDGRPSLSDDRCADFMAAISGLPRHWCLAWEAIEFAGTHGEDLVMAVAKIQGRWLSHCIGCGCNDLHACYDEADGCGCCWIELDRSAGRGVCSLCADERPRSSEGDRSFAVPGDDSDLAGQRDETTGTIR